MRVQLRRASRSARSARDGRGRTRGLRSVACLVSILPFLIAPPSYSDRHGEIPRPMPTELSTAEPSVGRKVFDAAILRPLQFVQVAVYAVAFVPAYPVAWAFDAEDDVMELCITEPVDRLFRRPLGEL